MRNLMLKVGAAMMVATMIGCGSSGSAGGGAGGGGVSGSLTVDGSSTVYPITQGLAEEFMKVNEGANITVNESGTGSGMKKFVAGEIDICDASRPIEPEEMELAAKAGVEFVEIPLAFDGLSVVVNPSNTFANDLTVAELKAIWAPDSKIDNWKQVRAGFPDLAMKLFGPGTASGTFEYFTEAVVGKKKASRADYAASEDDNVLVQGVAGEKGGLGYFGFSYYSLNKDKLKIVPVDGGHGPVSPSEQSIGDGTYHPLSRPLFVYVSKKALGTELGKKFVEYALGAEGMQIIKETGYVPLSEAAYVKIRARVAEGKTGSVFASGNWVGLKIEDILNKE